MTTVCENIDGNLVPLSTTRKLEAQPVEQDFKEFVDKKVVLVRNLPEPNAEGHSTVELEGFIVEANPKVGVLFRQRGRTNGELVFTHEVEDIRLLVTAPKPIKVKALKRMNQETVRQHLVDRHGSSVELVNATSDENAMKMHDQLHEAHGKDLGHNHGDPGSTES